MNFIAGFNRVIGGMFLIQTRGVRKNAEFCPSQFSKFYPVCYSEELESTTFGPNADPLAGELHSHFRPDVTISHLIS
jgi:hypothetical protein